MDNNLWIPKQGDVVQDVFEHQAHTVNSCTFYEGLQQYVICVEGGRNYFLDEIQPLKATPPVHPGIESTRRHINENYTSRGGLHYAGAQRDAAELLGIVDQLYAQLKNGKAQINLHILECDKRLEQYREMLKEHGDDLETRRNMDEHQAFRDGLARALKHLEDTERRNT